MFDPGLFIFPGPRAESWGADATPLAGIVHGNRSTLDESKDWHEAAEMES